MEPEASLMYTTAVGKAQMCHRHIEGGYVVKAHLTKYATSICPER